MADLPDEVKALVAAAGLGGAGSSERTSQGEMTFAEAKLQEVGAKGLSDKGLATLDQVLAWQAQAQTQERSAGFGIG